MEDLFESHKLRRNADPSTSHEAAESMETARSRYHRIIMSVFRSQVLPMNAEEVADRTEGLDKQQVVRRLNELEAAKLIVHVGQAKQRSGRNARTFCAVEYGGE